MPPAAFSALATTKSIPSLSTRAGTRSRIARRPGRPTTSPRIKTRIAIRARARDTCSSPDTNHGHESPLFYLSGVIHRADLPNDGDLDLPWIGHLILDLARNFSGHERCVFIGDGVMLDDDPYLSAGLNGIGFFHSLKRVGDALKFLQAPHVGLKHFPPRARASPRERIRGIH